MGYKSLTDCLTDLEKNGRLVRIKEEVDPYLEMAAIHLRVYEKQGPALLFENIKGSRFKAVSNLFGTLERSKFIFRDTLHKVEQLVALRNDPLKALKNPLKYFNTGLTALSALPLKQSLFKKKFQKTTISALPQIVNWPMDGGSFITMPQVFTEDVDKPGVMHGNLGMYRIQLAGNNYITDKEIGLHYQIHRGIGVHQAKANAKGKPLKVSIFVGGLPSHSLAAVMPLPEGLSELTFAGLLAERRFRYFRDQEGFVISADADFVITGTVYPHENKPEGPFGDHLGYYSLIHPFPLMKVHNVYHKKDAIWLFTVVGKPPQEDTGFGNLIHEITRSALPQEINGLKEVNAVDAAGVHPLLFAIGCERYTPYLKEKRPQEILTIANHILGKNQLSLAKYLFIAAREDNENLKTNDITGFFTHILERIDLTSDLHFYTNTTIDTLDYSGDGLNRGSKAVFAAVGVPIRKLSCSLPTGFQDVFQAKLAMAGIVAIQCTAYIDAAKALQEINKLKQDIKSFDLTGIPLIVICDDKNYTTQSVNNLVWVTFTKSNPATDIDGIDAFVKDKHWGCKGSLIIDARKKPHHAPELIKDADVERRIETLAEKGKSLFGIL